MLTCVKESFVVKPKPEELLEKEKDSISYWQILKEKAVVITILLYAVEALIQCSFDSLISLWLSAKREDGGFDLSIKEIGWFISCICPMQAGNCR